MLHTQGVKKFLFKTKLDCFVLSMMLCFNLLSLSKESGPHEFKFLHIVAVGELVDTVCTVYIWYMPFN